MTISGYFPKPHIPHTPGSALKNIFLIKFGSRLEIKFPDRNETEVSEKQHIIDVLYVTSGIPTGDSDQLEIYYIF